MDIKNFKNSTKIVIIDDNEDEGNDIRNTLDASKIPSVFYHITSNDDLPDKPLKNLRVIFLDLHFSESGTNPQINANIALAKLAKFLAKGSFYTLVVWSSHTKEQTYDFFINFLNRHEEIPKPIKVFPMDKSIRSISGEIDNKILEIFDSLPILKIFSEWQYIVENAISNTLSSIVDNSCDNEYLSKLVKSLSNASAGLSIPKKQVPKQALGTLNGILEDNISRELENKKFGHISRIIRESSLSDDKKGKLNYNLIFDPNISLKGSGSMYKKRLSKELKRDKIKNIFDNSTDFKPTSLDKINFYYMDVTPLCDSANSKGYKYYIESYIHPKKYVRLLNGSSKDITIKKGARYKIDKDFYLDGEKYSITIDLKSYCTNIELIKRCSSKIKIRSGIVLDIQHKIGEHLSRPGHKLL